MGAGPLAVADVEPPPGAAALAAETATFQELYEGHFDFVWRNARRLGVPLSSVDDVVQDVFLTVHRRLDDYDGRASHRAWLFGILAHVVRDHRRRYRRKESKVVSNDSHDSSSRLARATSNFPPPNQAAEHAEALRVVQTILEELDDEKREVLVLAQLEQMTAPEIAECLHENLNTVYARIRAARRAFDEALQRLRAREGKVPR